MAGIGGLETMEAAEVSAAMLSAFVRAEKFVAYGITLVSSGKTWKGDSGHPYVVGAIVANPLDKRGGQARTITPEFHLYFGDVNWSLEAGIRKAEEVFRSVLAMPTSGGDFDYMPAQELQDRWNRAVLEALTDVVSAREKAFGRVLPLATRGLSERLERLLRNAKICGNELTLSMPLGEIPVDFTPDRVPGEPYDYVRIGGVGDKSRAPGLVFFVDSRTGEIVLRLKGIEWRTSGRLSLHVGGYSE